MRSLRDDSTDEELDAAHQRTIARVRAGKIAWPRSQRPSIFKVGRLINARAREIMRRIPPDEIEDYRKTDTPNRDEWEPLYVYVMEQIPDEFDVQHPDDPEDQHDDLLNELHEIVDNAVGTWLAGYEARAAGLPPPVMTARDREIFRWDLVQDILKDKPPGTTLGEVLPELQAKLEKLERLRRLAGE
jgi:hypothetical protein